MECKESGLGSKLVIRELSGDQKLEQWSDTRASLSQRVWEAKTVHLLQVYIWVSDKLKILMCSAMFSIISFDNIDKADQNTL